MNKILVLLTTLLISVNSFSQSTAFAKAYELFIGYKADKYSETTWSDGTEVDILVVISKDKVKIYSSEVQEYRMTGKSSKTEDGAKYFAVDTNGLQCFVYLGKKDGVTYIIVEYVDYAWMYLLTPND
jgi:hypothetical protein